MCPKSLIDNTGDCLDPGKKFHLTERLRKVVIGPEGQSLHDVAFVNPDSQN